MRVFDTALRSVPAPPTPDFDSVIDRLARFEVQAAATTLNHLDQLSRVVEDHLSEKGRFQILFLESAVPTLWSVKLMYTR
jgi:hypothetical protein